MVDNAAYIHALRYSWLNWLYDPVVRVTTRESTVKATLIQNIPAASRGDLLDLGCGTGTLTRAVASTVGGYSVCGIDGDRDMVRRAEEKAATANLDVRYEHGLAQALPFDDNTFDVVTSTLLFHHLTSGAKRSALSEVRRVLEPSGVFLIADWGRPQNALMRMLFFGVQLLDGFEITEDSLLGNMPDLIGEAGFGKVEDLGDFSTLFGTISIYKATA